MTFLSLHAIYSLYSIAYHHTGVQIRHIEHGHSKTDHVPIRGAVICGCDRAHPIVPTYLLHLLYVQNVQYETCDEENKRFVIFLRLQLKFICCFTPKNILQIL